MSKVIDASVYIKNKNAENDFTSWFNEVFGTLKPRYMDVFTTVTRKLCLKSWEKCNAIWLGRYSQIKSNIADAIELCSCDDSECNSCQILKVVLLQDYT
jgi:hypothetical protein